ncbi:cytochrome P450 [Dentipellis sp. KUC8613]|nr:cytochrome P450 [Dentipellis sp. KUC8613]
MLSPSSLVSFSSPRNLFLLVVGILSTLLVAFTRWRRRSQNLPPSPRGSLPLIGHAHQMPSVRPWVWSYNLSRELDSDIVYLNLAGQKTVVINDYDTAVDLINKRSSVYSSRPHLVLAGDYLSTGKRIIFLPYGTTWRNHRAAVHQEMVPSKLQQYHHIQAAEVKLLMQRLLLSPSSFQEHFRQYSGNVILKIAYGLNSDDKRTEKAALMETLLAMANPGKLVDAFPFLDWLPDILAPWRADALRHQAHNQHFYRGLLHETLAKVDSGLLTSDQTFVSRLWQDREKLGMDELDVAYLAGSMFEGGMETTASTLTIFVMAMVTHPEVFRAIQEEVTNVCGDQPPIMENFEALPYVRAACKEVLRWRIIVPMGFPHQMSTDQDDTFRGYVIPAGSVIIANQYGMAMSDKTFGQTYNPLKFEPRRWLELPGGINDITEGHPAFGFTRRVCPGNRLAVNSLFLVIAHLGYYFNIEAAEGAPTVDTSVEGFTTGHNIEPNPFECKIVPRVGREADIEAQADAAREALGGL